MRDGQDREGEILICSFWELRMQKLAESNVSLSAEHARIQLWSV